jgi:cell fate regulator YaaT (PSP1 superfamily)
MPPVSMKMAKLQKATLDPTKISGRCGRLKCCLRYEFDTYEQLLREMPYLGSRVMTPGGSAKVVGHEILAGQLLVETTDGLRKLVPLSEVTPSSEGMRPGPTDPAPTA